MRVLLTWVGAQDPWRPREGRRTGKLAQMSATCPDDYQDGPLLDFLTHAEPFDAVHLVFDPPKEQLGAVAALANALKERDSRREVRLHQVPLDDPRRYRDLYTYLRAVCEAVEHAHPSASFHILLTPGTPQVHATWVLLAKTVFPATPWQTSEATNASRAEIADIPFNVQAELVEPAVERALSSARMSSVPGLVFQSKAMENVVREVATVAENSEAPLLLLGETGVGKERLARYAHEKSTRRAGPFVGLNCGAIPSNLVESELFGHERGAFTGAEREHKGLFEVASDGTLFLDEIGELSLDVQAKLLRVLQEHKVRRVGGSGEIAVNPRIIAATHQDLKAMVAERRFREDLFYRVAVCPIRIPALRERPEDIALLAKQFLDEENEKRKSRRRPVVRCSADAMRLLDAYRWPGNIRELKNLMERIAIFADGGAIGANELRALVPDIAQAFSAADGAGLNAILDDVARRLITQALAQYGSQEKAALALGLKSASALQGRMRTLGVVSGTKRERPK